MTSPHEHAPDAGVVSGESWPERNNAYLAAALHWLRLRLTRLINSSSPNPADRAVDESSVAARAELIPPSPAAAPKPKRRTFWQWLRNTPVQEVTPALVEQPRPASAPARSPVASSGPAALPGIDQEIAAAAARKLELETGSPLPALTLLTNRFGLSSFERDVLLLCLAMDLDTRTPTLCANAQADPLARYPTFALALMLFDDPVWEALAPDRPLRFWRLIDVRGGPVQPMTTSPLVADERIVNYCKGLNAPDSRLSELFVPFPFSNAETKDPPPSQSALVDAIIRRVSAASDGDPPIVHLIGTDRASKQVLARNVADHFGLPMLRLPTESLPGNLTDLEDTCRLLRRESALFPVALYVDAYEMQAATGATGPSPLNLNRLLGHRAGITLLDSRDVLPGLDVDTITIDVQPPTPAEQREAWAVAMGVPVEGLPSRLAGQFELSTPVIARIGRVVRMTSDGTEENLTRRAWEECLGHVRPQLDTLAERIEPEARWDDLILATDDKDLLRRIADQVRQRSIVYHDWGVAEENSRGLGITALFAGESGTGKTMAAEVLADELLLNLYRIDLSAVVSKYIGETEKNLRRLFDAAECGGTILFFDEADALFGKRSEVKDSHDRYANIEINYLLQRMEAYRGLAILATNMKTALDQAFTRRLRFIVTFSFPGPAERELIWRQAFARGVPTADLDYARLAKLNLSGGSIHNIAINATFLAAAAPDQNVTMANIASAARMELRKMNRAFNESDLDFGAGGGKT